MKLIRITLIVFLVLSLTDFALGQSGYYGSPDTLRMPEQSQTNQQPAAAQYNNQGPYAGQPGNVPVGYPQQTVPYGAPSGYAQPQAVPTGYGPQTSPYSTLNGSAPQNGPYGAPARYPSQPTATYPAPNQPNRAAPAQRPAYVAQQMPQPISAPQAMPQEPMPTLNEMPSQQNPGFNPIPSDQGQPGVAGNDQYVPFNGPCGPTQSSVQPQQASCSGNDSCSDIGSCFNACPWYASLSGLALTRNNANKLWTSNEPFPNEFRQRMNTQDAQTSWKMGGEIRFGRRFCCESCDPCNSPTGYWAVEADYWTTSAFEGFANCSNPNAPFTLNTPLTVANIQFLGTDGALHPGNYWFDGAAQHALWRRNEIQSVEINLVRGQWANVYGSSWDFAFNVGPRFFRFQESLMFGALRNTGILDWSQNGGGQAAYLSDNITNNLWGVQTGFDLGYNFATGALRLFATPKVGIYNNNINNTFRAELGNGTAATINYPGLTGTYPVESTTNCFAFMSQIDVGAEWFFAQRWSARVGYRAMAISGIGLADNQFPTYVNALDEIADIDTNGDLILHGAFATITFNF